MVQHCIETSFRKFLDVEYLHKVDENKSTHTYYSNDIGVNNIIFNHHDLTNSKTHEAFQRRCVRFMDEYQNGSLGLLYTIPNGNNDDDASIAKFAKFVSKTSPTSKLIVVKLKKTGTNELLVDFASDHVDMYTICYGECDNLQAVQAICDSYMV
jgi:hypothetical protein